MSNALQMLQRLYNRVAGDFVFAILFLCVLWASVSSYMPAIEGALFPVTINTKIEELSTAPDGNSHVKLTFSNIRDCEYVKLTWFKIDKDGKLQAAFVNFLDDDGVGSRGLGEHRTNTWYVSMPTDVLEHYSIAKVRHKCHGLWETVTQIYP